MLQQDIPAGNSRSKRDTARKMRGINFGDNSSFFAEAAATLGTELEIARGEEVALEPTRDSIIYICSGATKLIAKASRNREQIVAFHFRGDLVPIAAPDIHVYALEALRESRVVKFPAHALLEASKTDPIFMKEMLQRSLVSLYRCRDKALALGRKTAQERLASFLVAMAERIGTPSKGICDLELPMSRGDIADSLGLTIETISRQFSELRCAGLIETDGRFHVTLLDPAALAQRSGQF